MYLVGMGIGAAIGTLLIGGLMGWAIHKIFRLSYLYSDALGLVVLFLGAIFLNSEKIGVAAAIAVYGLASLFAYFVLTKTIRPHPANVTCRT